MTGSLQAKRGKYYAVLNFVDNTGKRKQKWVYTGYEVKNNLRKAEAAMRSIISEYESAQLIYEPNILISDYLDQWLTEMKPFIDTVTWDGYKVIVDSHVTRRYSMPSFRPAKWISAVGSAFLMAPAMARAGLI